MKESTIDQRVADLCGILESDAPKAMFDGETVAEMFNQILAGHSAESVASKRGITPKPKMPNDSSSATAATERNDNNQSGPPPFAEARG